MRSRVKQAVVTVAAVSAALMISSCSSPESAPRVAGDEGGGSGKKQDDAAVRRSWVKCMHDQGQTQIFIDKDGNIAMPASGTGASAGAGSSMDAYDKASKDCDVKNPGINQARAKTSAKFVEEARKFVACARKNGYGDLPDPDAKTGILNIPRASFDAAKWDAIQPACGKLGVSYSIGQ